MSDGINAIKNIDMSHAYPSALHRPGDNTAQDVKTDANLVFVVGGKISLEAVEDKILVLNDRFKSGYECKSCDGTGEIVECVCVTRFIEWEKNASLQEVTKAGFGLDRFGQPCKQCNGRWTEQVGKPCPACKGSGQSIIIPESSKQMPTSGVIVSLGPKCATRKIGERVLYGAHVGYNLPFKGNVRVRIMREHEILCLMEKVAPDASLEDFQLLQEPIDNMSGIR